MGESIVKGLAAVALHFNKSERQVRRWVKDGLPRLSGGRFDLLQVQAWLDRRQGGRGPVPPEDPEAHGQLPLIGDKDHWDKQGKKFQAQLRELEYRQKLGELIEVTTVRELLVARILAVKQGLLSLARALPPELASCHGEREMEAVIAREVRVLLEAYSRPLPAELTARDGGSDIC